MARPAPLLLLAAVTACAGGGGNANPARPASPDISGTVSGDLVAGVTVSLRASSVGEVISEVRTDASGNYRFVRPALGLHWVVPSKSGYVFSPASIPVSVEGEARPGQDFAASAIPASQFRCVWRGSGTSWDAACSSAPDDVWLVGECGMASHLTASGWASVPAQTTENLRGVWGSGPSDVWAVGEAGAIVHWDGKAWTSAASGTTRDLRAVWGSGPGDVWAVGAGGAIVHFDGGSWSAVTSGTTEWLYGVWGSAAGDVWAVGDCGTILHWKGSSWSAVASGTLQALHGVWGSAAGDVWAVGDVGTMVHFDGTDWKRVATGAVGDLHAVWGSGANDVWAAGQTAPGVGVAFDVFRWNGSAWSAVDLGWNTVLHGVWGSGPEDVWAVGLNGAFHWNGTGWAWPGYGPPAATLSALGGTGSSDVWAVGRSSGGPAESIHWDGQAAWTSAPTGPMNPFHSIWAASTSDAWAVVTGGMARWNGSTWASVPLEYHDLHAIWGAAAGDVWAVGSGGDILHFDGASWTTVESGTTAPLAGLWGTGPSDVWAAGGGIMHYDGSAWSTVSSGRPSATAVWASGPSDVWAVGNDSLQHFDGQTWVEFQGHQGMGGTFVGISGYGWSSVWGSGRNDVWIVGGAGGALHWNGTTLAAVSSGTTSQLNAVWGAGTDVWVATANDTILKILR